MHQVALYPSHDGNAAKRMVNYASFFVTGLWRMMRLLSALMFCTHTILR